MKAIDRKVVIGCLQAVLRPILAFCLRHSLQVQDVIESVKIVLLDLAAQEIQRDKQKVNLSRLSAITGLHRRDVQRIYAEGRTKDYAVGVINRVIGQWQEDPRFITAARKPRVLSFEGEDSDFFELMRSIPTDLKPGTVLFELERLKAVKRVSRGLKLVVQSYEPEKDPEEGFQMLADDLEDLVVAVDENMFMYSDRPHLHAKTVYDNVCQDDLPKIQQWLLREGAAFHRKARSFISKFDLDVYPRAKRKGGVRVAVGTFSRMTSVPQEQEDDEAANQG